LVDARLRNIPTGEGVPGITIYVKGKPVLRPEIRVGEEPRKVRHERKASKVREPAKGKRIWSPRVSKPGVVALCVVNPGLKLPVESFRNQGPSEPGSYGNPC